MSILADFVSNAAYHALLYEANVTPKPGLVDMSNTGAHEDMTLSMLAKSAEAVSPYIGQCARIGFETKNASFESAFRALQKTGLEAEEAMKQATGGVNTHKGAIYCFSLLAGAYGRNLYAEILSPDVLCQTASLLSKEASGSSLESASRSPVTHGDIAFQKAHLSGARGEALSGYPSILNIALPALEYACQKGFSENDAGVYALLHLISKVDDTCIYSRGGAEGLMLSKSLASDALQGNFMEKAGQIDSVFIKKRLSPGGCADLLAAAIFIQKLTSTKWEEYTCE